MKKLRILIPIAMAILSFHLASVAAASPPPLDIWTWRNPLPTGNQLNGVTYGTINGKGLFVAVGTNGTIVTSANGGINWDQQVVPPNISLSGVVFSPDLTVFVAVGAEVPFLPNSVILTNVILTSPDGITWTPRQVGRVGAGGLIAVAYGGGNFVAVGAGGITLYSSNGGTTWNQGTSGTNVNLNAVTYGSSAFVAAGNGIILSSTTGGSSWTASTLNNPGGNFHGIAFGNNTFVAVGEGTGLFYSTNGGANFHLQANNTIYSGDCVIYANSEFIVANTVTYYPSILTSPDGQTWTPYSEPPWLFGAIAYGSGTFVGVGGGDEIATNSLNVTVGSDWNSIVTSLRTTGLNAIAFGTTSASGSTPGVNLFVAGGAGNGQFPAVVTSPDGYAWTSDTDSSLSQFLLYNSFITGMAYGTKNVNAITPEFVATVNTLAGYTPNVKGAIISSTNCISWATNFFNTNVLNGIAYGNGKFVAVGNNGTNVSSSDLKTWTSGTGLPSAVSFNGVAWGSSTNGATNFNFVAVGAGNAGWFGQVIYYSTVGGLTWTPATFGPPFSEDFTGVTFGNGQFVAVGVDNSEPTPEGVIYTSSDGGATWNQVLLTSYTFALPEETAPPPYNSVTFANGLFVAVTSSDVTSNNVTAEDGIGAAIFISVDGVNWVQASIVTPTSLNAVAYGNNQYIAVGGGGTIVGSQLPAVTGGSFVASTNTFSFTISGPTGTYGVWVSSNLAGPYAWLPPNVTFSSTMPSATVNDPNAGKSISGYYYLGRPGP